MAYITKILQMCFRKKWNSNIFLQRKLFQRKKSQKRAKRPNGLFKAVQLEMRSKRPKTANKIFRPNNLKRGKISEIFPEKANLATLIAPIRPGCYVCDITLPKMIAEVVQYLREFL